MAESNGWLGSQQQDKLNSEEGHKIIRSNHGRFPLVFPFRLVSPAILSALAPANKLEETNTAKLAISQRG